EDLVHSVRLRPVLIGAAKGRIVHDAETGEWDNGLQGAVEQLNVLRGELACEHGVENVLVRVEEWIAVHRLGESVAEGCEIRIGYGVRRPLDRYPGLCLVHEPQQTP